MRQSGGGAPAITPLLGVVLAVVLAMVLAVVPAVLVSACGERAPKPPAREVEDVAHSDAGTGVGPGALAFTDVTEASGVRFVHRNFATASRYLPETMGAGVAVFDMDGDERPDLVFVDGAPVDGPREGPAGAVYRNRGDGTFDDVTEGAGLGPAFLGMGAAVGDVDGDDRLDLFVSGVGEQRLYLNRTEGPGRPVRFEDVTHEAGLRLEPSDTDLGFGSSAAFLDADGDGRLDLYVGRYVPWTPERDVRCSPDGEHHTYCTPEVYDGAANVFYRNLGADDGTVRFEDQTAAWGLDRPVGKTLGVAVLDHGRDAAGDGRPDLAVANDTDRNHLFVQSGPGRYQEIGVEAGMAYSVSGSTRGAMGIDAGDVDGDGLTDLAVGNFAQEMTAIYAGQPAGLYRDEAAALGVGLPSLMQVAFGTLLVDLDLDGRLDLVLANGHIEPEIRQYQSVQSYAQPLGVYRNLGERFEQVTSSAGPLAESYVGRGLAAADLDGDGDLDLVLTQNGREAKILRNDAAPSKWLRVRLQGTAANPTGYGAVVEIEADGRTQRRRLTSGRSYLSASEPVLTFGLGDAEGIDRVVVTWPSGASQVVSLQTVSLQTDPSQAVNQLLVVQEPAVGEPAVSSPSVSSPPVSNPPVSSPASPPSPP